jgi:hypothetical protein
MCPKKFAFNQQCKVLEDLEDCELKEGKNEAPPVCTKQSCTQESKTATTEDEWI